MSNFKAPTFQECIKKDIKNTFLDTEKGLAEKVEFDGVEVDAVISNNDSREPQTKESDALGIFKWDRCLQINMEDLPHKPAFGNYVRLNDGQMQAIAHIEEDVGMYLIYLIGNER